MKFYAGIGSRDTPDEVQLDMCWLANELGRAGYTLRSGNAPGADKAFAMGAGLFRQQIFLPWPGFNGMKEGANFDPLWAAIVANKYHPAWDDLDDAGRKLHTRSTCQVLGPNKYSLPSLFVACWTPRGETVGGSAQAIKIARDNSIPVFNLYDMTVQAVKKVVLG